PFLKKPYRTMGALSIPITLSLLAEPITGLVDTGFVAQLGVEPLAALGVGTGVLSTFFWVFNFLGISTQTEVAQAVGNQNHTRAGKVTGQAFLLAGMLGVLFIGIGLFAAPAMSLALGAAGQVQADAVTYIHVRLFSAPAVLLTMVGFGALRGMQDMQTPMWIAIGINIMNITLDPILMFGVAFIPPMGIAGAALASAFSQWVGALWLLWRVQKALPLSFDFKVRAMLALLRVGGDVFIRTGALTLFLLWQTRIANQISPEAGASHQVLRSMMLVTALGLDGLAVTAQSMVAYFLGANAISTARRVAAVTIQMTFVVGIALTVLMLGGTNIVTTLMLPPEALDVFMGAWIVSAVLQSISALAFATDGVLWGTGDYAFMRNTMLAAFVVAGFGLSQINPDMPDALVWVWIAYAGLVAVRAVLGILRVYPGIGDAPLKSQQVVL
ncbi:MAG: MATE family efflux transporter, partial [Aggregatilineales bacterium]